MFSPPVGAEQLAERLSREIGLFEQKVVALEERCRQIRLCAVKLASELHAASISFLGETPGGESPGACREATETPLIHLVELCGIKDHAEIICSRDGPDDRVDLIVHEPGGGTLSVDGQLQVRGLGNGEISEAVHRRMAELRARSVDNTSSSCAVRIVYVPLELSIPESTPAASGQRLVVATPSALFAILKGVAIRWLSFSCARNARALVDSGQDLVDDLSSFISDFTESEKGLCDFVDRCIEASRALDLPSPRTG